MYVSLFRAVVNVQLIAVIGPKLQRNVLYLPQFFFVVILLRLLFLGIGHYQELKATRFAISTSQSGFQILALGIQQNGNPRTQIQIAASRNESMMVVRKLMLIVVKNYIQRSEMIGIPIVFSRFVETAAFLSIESDAVNGGIDLVDGLHIKYERSIIIRIRIRSVKRDFALFQKLQQLMVG